MAWLRVNHLHFIEKEMQAQGAEAVCPPGKGQGSNSAVMVETGLLPGQEAGLQLVL